MPFYQIGNVVVSDDEIHEVKEKLSEMDVNVGISLSQRESAILQELLKTNLPEVLVDHVDEEKEGRISVKAMDGHCYVHLLPLLPSYPVRSAEEVLSVVDQMIGCLGQDPYGTDIVTTLVLCEYALANHLTLEESERNGLESTISHTETLSEVFKCNNVRYTYEEYGGILHLVRTSGFCPCTDVLCNHGWSARFIIQLIARAGVKVGAADVDFSALFIQPGHSESEPDPVGKPTSLRPAPLVDRHVEAEKRHKIEHNLDMEMTSMLSAQLERRTEMLERMFKEIVQEKGIQEPQNGEHVEGSVVSTLGPRDSSSTMSRYLAGKRFMPEPSYNLRGGKTVLEVVSEEPGQQTEKQVIRGFLKTDGMRSREIESNERVYTINGLAAPFKNSRLNFLIHMTTALAECSFNPRTDPIDALEEIGTKKPRNPTGELMRQVIQRTFCFKEMAVIANPFRIPFIEVGMLLSDSSVLKMLDLLNSEYKMLWFEELKCLRVPPFHKDYLSSSTNSEQLMQSNSKEKHRRRSERVGSKPKQSTSKSPQQWPTRKTTSILGLKI